MRSAPNPPHAEQTGGIARSLAPLRLVVDTQTWLDLLWFDDPRARTLKAALSRGRVDVVHDDHGLAEWTRLLAYPQLRISAPDREQLILQFNQCSRPFGHAPEATERLSAPSAPLPRCRDPDDQPFLQLAQAAAARFLVSRDLALLKLDRRCRRIAGFAVVRAEAAELQAALA